MIDTHCHLDDLRFNEDIDVVIARAKERGVNQFIIPGADPKTLQRAVEIAERYDCVYFAVGVHPYDALSYDKESLKPFVSHPKCVAIGECGLDYYRLPQSPETIVQEKERQKEIFIDQIIWANALHKPLIVHIREASQDAQLLLEQYAKTGGVLHCYNADESLLKLSSLNFYFGIGGVLTFKNAKKLLHVYPKIPQERLLIETDAPYLTPHPHRGERNEPAYVALVMQNMATLSQMSEEEMIHLTRVNTFRLFGI